METETRWATAYILQDDDAQIHVYKLKSGQWSWIAYDQYDGDIIAEGESDFKTVEQAKESAERWLEGWLTGPDRTRPADTL